MSFALLSMVSGVSLFFAFLICALISVLLKTDSVWVFVLVGGPVAALFAVGWAVRLGFCEGLFDLRVIAPA